MPHSAVVVHRMQDDDEGREAEPPLPMPSREPPREAGKLTEETRGSNSKMRFFLLDLSQYTVTHHFSSSRNMILVKAKFGFLVVCVAAGLHTCQIHCISYFLSVRFV